MFYSWQIYLHIHSCPNYLPNHIWTRDRRNSLQISHLHGIDSENFWTSLSRLLSMVCAEVNCNYLIFKTLHSLQYSLRSVSSIFRSALSLVLYIESFAQSSNVAIDLADRPAIKNLKTLTSFSERLTELSVMSFMI